MVLYICNKCNKNFTRKQSYEIHINRKKTCITENNINKIINLEDKTKNLEEDNNKLEDSNQQLEDSNKKLENKNKQLEDSNKELENKLLEVEKENNKNLKLKENYKELENKNRELNKENNMFKGENKTLKELLNNKDIEIKDLYKNIYYKIKDNDIKIKMTEGYIYIIRECDFVRLNENIYKIGRTAKINPEDRFQKYRKGTEIIGFFKVNDSVECENKIIKCFSNHTNITKMKEYGKEYFQGNKNELLNEMLQIIKNYNT
jgi:DNA repair exonuclease SbcCD ATPase subunit